MADKNKEAPFIVSELNTPMINYSVYVMNTQEKITTFLTSFIIGGIVGLVFYGGQFKNNNGDATMATMICNVIIFVAVGLIASKIYYGMKIKDLKEKRITELTDQFRSLLDAFSVSLSSGMNVPNSLQSACVDLKSEYSEDAYIVKEVEEMINGIENNIPIERMMAFLGERSGIEDIKNFATVFEVSYRAGGNLKDIVRRTNRILSEKIEIKGEIETAISSNKTQFSAMMIIPVVMMLLLRFMSSSFAESFATVAGVFSISIAIVLFVIAYRLGQKIMDIKG